MILFKKVHCINKEVARRTCFQEFANLIKKLELDQNFTTLRKLADRRDKWRVERENFWPITRKFRVGTIEIDSRKRYRSFVRFPLDDYSFVSCSVRQWVIIVIKWLVVYGQEGTIGAQSLPRDWLIEITKRGERGNIIQSHPFSRFFLKYSLLLT